MQMPYQRANIPASSTPYVSRNSSGFDHTGVDKQNHEPLRACMDAEKEKEREK
jgi:hypothetical protein